MKNLFKFKKCNNTTKWVCYSDEFLDKMNKSHPMAAPILVQSHLDFLNNDSKYKHLWDLDQTSSFHETHLSKINELIKNKTLHQHYAYLMVSTPRIFDVLISTNLEERLSFLNYYLNLIYPLNYKEEQQLQNNANESQN